MDTTCSQAKANSAEAEVQSFSFRQAQGMATVADQPWTPTPGGDTTPYTGLLTGGGYWPICTGCWFPHGTTPALNAGTTTAMTGDTGMSRSLGKVGPKTRRAPTITSARS